MAQQNLLRICALWKGQTRNGDDFYRGRLNGGIRVLVFTNTNKRTDKDPDATIYFAPVEDDDKDGGKDGGGRGGGRGRGGGGRARDEEPPPEASGGGDGLPEDDDVPF